MTGKQDVARPQEYALVKECLDEARRRVEINSLALILPATNALWQKKI